MPDPAWTQNYATNQSPESNGFTRNINRSPVITEITTGNPANRRVEIDSDNGDVVFLTSSVPSLDPLVGVTIEADIQTAGPGDAGFELTFLNAAVLVNVYSGSVDISIPRGDDGTGASETTFITADNGDTEHIWRYTFDASRNVRLYRDEILVGGPILASTVTKPFQRVLWWGEGGGTQIYWGFRYFIGGAVVPG